MEQKGGITRVVEPIETDKITCNVPCGGEKALENTDEKKVCDIFGAPARNGFFVDSRIHPNLERECILLNSE